MDHCQWDSGVPKGQLCVFSLSAYQLTNWMKNPTGPKPYCRHFVVLQKNQLWPQSCFWAVCCWCCWETICKYNEASRCCPPLSSPGRNCPWSAAPCQTKSRSCAQQDLLQCSLACLLFDPFRKLLAVPWPFLRLKDGGRMNCWSRWSFWGQWGSGRCWGRHQGLSPSVPHCRHWTHPNPLQCPHGSADPGKLCPSAEASGGWRKLQYQG